MHGKRPLKSSQLLFPLLNLDVPGHKKTMKKNTLVEQEEGCAWKNGNRRIMVLLLLTKKRHCTGSSVLQKKGQENNNTGASELAELAKRGE